MFEPCSLNPHSIRGLQPLLGNRNPVGHLKSLICLVPSLDSNHPKYIVSDLENHTVITDTESVCMRAGERFSELKRIRLLGIKAHLGDDALLILAG